MREVVLTWPEAPVFMNAAAKMHWAKRNRIISEWRTLFGTLALAYRNTPFEKCHIEVVCERRNRRHLPDAAASEFTSKAAIDGIVDAGLLPDDNPNHVLSIVHRFEVTGRDALTIRLSEAP